MVPLFDVNGLDMDEISDIFDCFQIQVTQNIQLPSSINFSKRGLKHFISFLFFKNKGLIGGKGLIALRPWRGCIRTKEGCTND